MLFPLIQTAHAQVSGQAVAGETESQLQGLFDFFVVKIPSFIAAFIVFVLFFFIAKAIKGIVESKMSQRFEDHKEMQILAGRTASTTTIIVGGTIALNIAGIDLTVIIAAAGFGIGFALKDIIINFLAGVFTLAQKQYTIGDFIKVNDTIGKVIEIQARATVLQALDGTRVVVPNSELFTKQVVSYTSNPFRRIELGVGVEYDTDLNLAVKTCYRALKNTNGILIEPKPAVLIDEFGESSINLKIRGWVESQGGWLAIRSDLAANVKAGFDKVGINIPFPIRTIVYDKDSKVEQEANKGKAPKWIEKERQPEKQQKPKAAPQPAPKQPVLQKEASGPSNQTKQTGEPEPAQPAVKKQQKTQEQSQQQSQQQSAPKAPSVAPKSERGSSVDKPGASFLKS